LKPGLPPNAGLAARSNRGRASPPGSPAGAKLSNRAGLLRSNEGRSPPAAGGALSSRLKRGVPA
jgi:hypothetical protein